AVRLVFGRRVEITRYPNRGPVTRSIVVLPPRGPDRPARGAAATNNCLSLLRDRRDLVGHHLPAPLHLHPDVDETVWPAAFLAAIDDLQHNTASDNGRVPENADLFVLAADGVKLGRAALDVLHAVLLGKEFATTAGEGVAIGPDLVQRRQMARGRRGRRRCAGSSTGTVARLTDERGVRMALCASTRSVLGWCSVAASG